MVLSDLGQQLKDARLAKGLSLDDVQEVTKIRKRYLEAIEAGDYKVLPGSFYVRAFIKTYAEAVDIDPELLLEEHSEHVPATVSDQQVMEPVIQKRRSRVTTERNSKWLSTTLMWSFALIILIVIYIYITKGTHTNDAAKNQETDPTRITQNEKNPTKQEEQGASNGDSTQNGDKDQAEGDTEKTPTDSGTNTDDTGTTPENSANNGTDDVPQNIAVLPDGKEGSTTKFKVQNSGGQPVQVTITASGKSWMDVRKGNRTGEKLFYDNTTEGQVLNFDLGPEGLYIKSGVSSYTQITVAGTVVEDGKNTSKIQLNLDAGDNSTNTGSTE
jgi:cytoskeleton protein RodZ